VIALLFPGQGVQGPGMGASLVEAFPEARQTFAEASEALGIDVLALCARGTREELARTAVAQPLILTVSVAGYRALSRAVPLEVGCAAGHSLGEYSALVCAGALAFADAVRLVRLRGEAMQAAVPAGQGGMLAVLGGDREAVRRLVREESRPGDEAFEANDNAPDQVVLSGHLGALGRIQRRLAEAGAVGRMLDVSAPFHTPLMAPAAERFRAALAEVALQPPRWPVLSCVTAQPHGDVPSLRERLVEQIVRPVQWRLITEWLAGSVSTTVEVGPRAVLTAFLRPHAGRVRALTFTAAADLAGLTEALGKGGASVAPTPAALKAALVEAASAPNRNFDVESHDRLVVGPYQQLLALRQEVEQGRALTAADGRTMVQLVTAILTGKCLPPAEVARRVGRILKVAS
jgi:[acyl-carrier-protein] S-malonyltransferase